MTSVDPAIFASPFGIRPFNSKRKGSSEPSGSDAKTGSSGDNATSETAKVSPSIICAGTRIGLTNTGGRLTLSTKT